MTACNKTALERLWEIRRDELAALTFATGWRKIGLIRWMWYRRKR